jgi:hypothetical protein
MKEKIVLEYEPSPKTRQEFLNNINYSLAQLHYLESLEGTGDYSYSMCMGAMGKVRRDYIELAAFDAGYTAATRNAVAYMKRKKDIDMKEQIEKDFLWVKSVTEN